MREEKRLLPVRVLSKRCLTPRAWRPLCPEAAGSPGKVASGAARGPAWRRCGDRRRHRAAAACHGVGGGGEGAVAFSLFSGLSCVSPDFSDGYMWLAKLDLEINARYCISICM